MAYAYKSLELSDNVGLYSRNLEYKLDLSELDLLPDFHARIDERTAELVLDARPTIIGLPAEAASYRWSYRNHENSAGGPLGVNEVGPSDEVVHRVPLSAFNTAGTAGIVDIKLDLQVTGVHSRGRGETTFSKTIVRSVQVADPDEAEPPDVGTTFRDTLSSGGVGPEMVVIPAGSFRMGCLNDDGDCYSDEFPVHTVNVPRFALSQYEVTFAEWDACVAAGGCNGYQPGDRGWGRGDRPVIPVSWNDAQSYVAWLSAQTGEEYRLPSEAEWEYAARAGTETRYHWGDAIGVNRANCDGCGSQWDNRETAPVGSFAPNAWSLYDMHGNAMEWTEDCWNNSYTGAPNDGSAWESGNCSRRVLRGGSWDFYPRFLRSADRDWLTAGLRDHDNGFRIARSLP